MLAKVTVCPFEDPEHIANCLERGMFQMAPVIQERLQNIKDAGLSSQADELDDAYLAGINAGANELIRGTICIYCDTNNQCHPRATHEF